MGHGPLVAYDPKRVGWTTSCTCGWVDPWYTSTERAARLSWVQHALDIHLPPDWPDYTAKEVS